jgi:hypothetical protein
MSSLVAALVVTMLGTAFTAARADAAPVTVNFSGTGDLSAVGLSIIAFTASVTWESDADPFEAEDDGSAANYDVISYSLFLNGVDFTEPVIGDGTGSGISVINDTDPFEPGAVVDALAFFVGIDDLLPSGNSLILIAALPGPTTMFDSTALPSNLDFLPLVSPFSAWIEETTGDGGGPLLAIGTLTATAPGGPGPGTPVPEPSTLSLIAIGLTGTIAGARNRRRSANID